jgi:mannose-6-phosphate isomerase-like protein (cupin superfamily)
MDKVVVEDVSKHIAQGLDQEGEGFTFAFAQKAETGSVELIRIDKGVALHTHPKGNEILYIVSGHGRGQIGDQTAEVGPGQIIVIPAGVPHKLERTGDDPLDIIDFSTPAFDPNDIVWLK